MQLDANERQIYLTRIAKEISNYPLEPFKVLLARAVAAFPDVEAMLPFFAKYPDRGAQTIIMLARAAGYKQDAPIIQNDILINIERMSDSELRQLRAKQDLENQQLMERTVEGEVDSLTPSHDAKDGKDPLTHLYGELEVDINSP